MKGGKEGKRKRGNELTSLSFHDVQASFTKVWRGKVDNELEELQGRNPSHEGRERAKKEQGRPL